MLTSSDPRSTDLTASREEALQMLRDKMDALLPVALSSLEDLLVDPTPKVKSDGVQRFFTAYWTLYLRETKPSGQTAEEEVSRVLQMVHGKEATG